jgi:FdhE protein
VSATGLAAPTAEGLALAHPEFRGWLDVLAAAEDEARRPEWGDAVPECGVLDGAPRLAGASLTVAPEVAAAWLERLFQAAGGTVPALRGGSARLDPLRALSAALGDEPAALDALADGARLPCAAVRAVLPVAAWPWLERCGARLAAEASTNRERGWCPICGAWATLAEARGLEGTRRLRCGRCGGDWLAEWLQCPFCGTAEHGKLRGLVGETTGQTRRVDGCAACGAWIKTLTTLAPAGTAEVRRLDLATVDLDVAALARGWRRPEGAGAPLGVRVVARPPRRWWSR